MKAHVVLEIIGAVLMAVYFWEGLEIGNGNRDMPWIMQITYPLYCVAIVLIWIETR